MNKKIDVILNTLDRLYPNPKCELNYHQDYELLMAVVLSSQTTDKRVNEVTKELFTKYPNLKKLKCAKLSDLEHILRPIGTFHKKAIFIKDIATILDEKYHGVVPSNRAILETLPGVGRKTASVVLSVLYNEPCIAVDTHVARVSKRLKLANKKDNVKQIEHKLMKLIAKDKWSRSHHQLVLFGRYHCKAIKPECSNCYLKDICQKKE